MMWTGLLTSIGIIFMKLRSRFVDQLIAIVGRDLAAEVHSREVLSAMLIFAVTAVLIFGFALDLQGWAGQAAAPGVVWTTLVFSGTLGLNRSLARDQADGGLDGLLLACDDRLVVFAGKTLSNLVMMLVTAMLLFPLGRVLFGVSLLQPRVAVVTLLGVVGYAVVGTLIGFIAVNTRAREVMLPILVLPLTVPLLLAVVQATVMLLAGGDASNWIRILVAYDLVMAAVAVLTFDAVIMA